MSPENPFNPVAVEQDAMERNLQQIRNSFVTNGLSEKDADTAIIPLRERMMGLSKQINFNITRAGFSFSVGENGTVAISDK